MLGAVGVVRHDGLGEADEGRPAVLVRGVTWHGPPLPATALVRDPELDLFR